MMYERTGVQTVERSKYSATAMGVRGHEETSKMDWVATMAVPGSRSE